MEIASGRMLVHVQFSSVFLKLKNQRKTEETQLRVPSTKAEAVDDVKVGAEELWVTILGISLTSIIHPASRGVAAHTAGFFRSVTGAK